jgi:hypothetical protein
VPSRAIVLVFVLFWGVMECKLLYGRLPGLVSLVRNGTVITCLHEFKYALDPLWSSRAV